MDKNNITNWLERLQQESWHLELLVSGFSILLLVQASQQLIKLNEYVDLHYAFSEDVGSILNTFLGMGILSCAVLTICLIIHIVLRGFWIGTIGLRSVQPKVDFKRLRYAPAFDQRLEEKLPSLDGLLIRLDKVSSSIFSFAFLVIFMLLSLVAWFLSTLFSIMLRDYICFEVLDEESSLSNTLFTIFTILVVALFLFSILYLFDTLTVGGLKRIKWLKSRPYIWIYQLMTVLTLSFVYRSIYYHLVSYFGVWTSRILLSSFILSMIFVPFLRLDHEIYFPDLEPSNKVQSYYYDDIRTTETSILTASISSSTVATNQIPLFIRYSPERNETIGHLCTNYKPSRKVGLSSGIMFSNSSIGLGDPTVEEASSDSLLACLVSIYQVSVDDSLYQDQQYYYLEHPNRGELGIHTVLSIKSLEAGHHQIKIDYQHWQEHQDTIITKNLATIPFWKE
ncbi:MAG: hypothetical protein AAGG68_09560 [Bacteroidota bacterium]